MTINYDYYRIFYVVAQCRSFTRAAELLKNNQPNITRCMKNLEQELGCKLFHRSNKGITLTPEGQRFYRRVAAAVEQLQLGEEEIRRDGSLESGSLSISASEAALHMILLDKLSIFRAQYPGVHLRITNETTPQAIERLRDGESDFAVITAPLPTGRTLQQTELLRFTEIPVCGPAYSDMAARRCTMAELANCPLVCLGEDTSTYAFYQSFFNSHGQPFRVDVEAATMDQILPMVEHGLGIGFYPSQLAAPRIARGELFCIPLDQPVPERAITLVEDTARPRSTAMKAIRELICEKSDRFQWRWYWAACPRILSWPDKAKTPPSFWDSGAFCVWACWGRAGGGLLLDLQLLLAVDAAVLAARAQLKDLVALLLDGGDAAGVAAADDVYQPAGRMGFFLLDGLALVDGGDGDVGVQVGQHVQVEPGGVPLHLDDVLAAGGGLGRAGVLD